MSINLLRKLHEIDVIRYGEFILKNGEKSNIYCDFRRMISHPQILMEMSLELGKLIGLEHNDQNVVIAGVPMGAIPISSNMSFAYNIPGIMIRQKRKSHGTQKMIEGDYKGQDIILVEDVCTSGTSIVETLEILKNENVNVKHIVVILDREKGGMKRIRDMGFTVSALYKLSELMEPPTPVGKSMPNLEKPLIQTIVEYIQKKKSNLIVSPDVADHQKVLELLDQVGPHILGVKLHSDIFDPSVVSQFIEKVIELKNKHHFLVIEDRKFSDIGSIVDKQGKIIKQWADIVTAHGVVGEPMIKALNDLGMGILPIFRLSTKDNLIDNKYSWRVKEMADRYENVIGFITQEDVKEGLLNFTPGVNIKAKGDDKGQQYNTPEVMQKKGTHIFIVGRGIYQAENPLAATKEYQERCMANSVFES